MKKNAFLLIDPQNDFIELPNSSLPVKGSIEDMNKVITKIKNFNFNEIIVTLDTHFVYDIAHKSFWINDKNEHPKNFTIITRKDVMFSKWKPVDNSKLSYCLDYLYQLEINGKYQLIIWPDHCIANTYGHEVYEPLKQVLNNLEKEQPNSVHYYTKGENPLTEHYSAITAEVKLADDPKTRINKDLVEKLSNFENIYVAGEAFSHCVYFTVKDLMNCFKAINNHKTQVVIYENATSPVSGFEDKIDLIKQELTSLNVKFEKI